MLRLILVWAALLLGTAAASAQATVQLAPPGQTPNSQVCGSAVSSCVLKASSGNLFGVYANCTSACWVMVFNAIALPSNGATTAGTASGNLSDCFEVAAGSSKSLFYVPYPKAFSVGMTVAISSTACATLTASSVGFVSGVYK